MGASQDVKTCNPNSQRVWVEYTKLTGYELHMPQKLVVLAAGTGDDAKTLCHAKDGDLGRDAPALSMIECFDFIYDLKINFPNTFFVMYGMGYEFTEIMRELPYEVAWEIQNQMPFSNKALKPEERDEPDVQRETFYITPKTPDGKPRTCYGLNYLKGKWFKIGRISNVPDIIPEGWPWYREVEKVPEGWPFPPTFITKRVPYDHGKMVEIHDTVSFFQCSFLDAIDGMRSSIDVSQEDRDLIEWGKPKRGVFADEPMNKIIAY
jgi:hypothetical protein